MKSQKIRHYLLFFLLLPLILSAQQRTFTHINKNGSHHTGKEMNYKSWDDNGWWAKVSRNTFTHARKSDFVGGHNDVIINYTSWDGTKWTAKVDGDTWIHAPNGDFNKAHQSKIIHYLTPYNGQWIATFQSYQDYLNSNPTTPPPPSPVTPKTFTHIHKDGRYHTAAMINYKSWDNSGWWAKVNDNTFSHARKSDFIGSKNNAIINYVSWNNTKWSAKVDGNTWLHAPNGDFSKAHQSKTINYLTPYQEQWTATFESYQTYKSANGTPPPVVSDGIIIVTQPTIIHADFTPPPVFTLPGSTTIHVNSLLDICPNESRPFLLEDLGLYNRLADIPTFEAAKAICVLSHQALSNYSQNLAHYKVNLPTSIANSLSVDNLRNSIRTHPSVKNAVNGILFGLITNTISNTSDQSTGAKAIRKWAADLYKNLNVMITQNTLREYHKWKFDPCTYPGYRCPSKLGGLLSAPKPPMKLIAENGFNTSFVDAASIAGAVTIAGGAIGVALGANLLAVALAPTGVSLFATFGGAAGAAVGSTAMVWAGPGAIIVTAIAAGILEAINVAAAADAERKLLDQVNTAKNENVNIHQVLQSKEKSSLLLTAFLNLANT